VSLVNSTTIVIEAQGSTYTISTKVTLSSFYRWSNIIPCSFDPSNGVATFLAVPKLTVNCAATQT